MALMTKTITSSLFLGFTVVLFLSALRLFLGAGLSTLYGNINQKNADPSAVQNEDDYMDGPPPLFCSHEQLLKGYWTDPERNATPPYLPSDQVWFRQGCYGGGSGDLRGYYKSSWVVSSDECRFDEWNEETFCDLAANKTFAFIGDSITWQQFSSLKYLLHFSPGMETAQVSSVQVCSNRTQLVWARNNYLDALGVQRILQRFAPVQVVVANRGIHYKRDEELVPSLNATLGVLKAWQESDGIAAEDKLLVWRTTAPGIPGCSNEFAPNNDIDFILTTRVHNRSSWYTEGQRSNFAWWDIQRQNRVVMSLLEGTLHKFDIIDGFAMNTRRPDLHMSQNDGREKDCLHYCLPGVPDESNRVLQHLLQRQGIERESKEHADNDRKGALK